MKRTTYLRPKHDEVLAKNIFIKRLEKGFTAEILSSSICRPPTYIKRFESGDIKVLTDETIQKIAIVLRVPIEDLTKEST